MGIVEIRTEDEALQDDLYTDCERYIRERFNALSPDTRRFVLGVDHGLEFMRRSKIGCWLLCRWRHWHVSEYRDSRDYRLIRHWILCWRCLRDWGYRD